MLTLLCLDPHDIHELKYDLSHTSTSLMRGMQNTQNRLSYQQIEMSVEVSISQYSATLQLVAGRRTNEWGDTVKHETVLAGPLEIPFIEVSSAPSMLERRWEVTGSTVAPIA